MRSVHYGVMRLIDLRDLKSRYLDEVWAWSARGYDPGPWRRAVAEIENEISRRIVEAEL